MNLVGQRFAYREHPRKLGDPVTPVDVVKLGPAKSNQVQIQYLEGEYAGLKEWVSKNRLVVPWAEADAFCRNEKQYLGALDASGDVCETLLYKAVDTALSAVVSIFDAEHFILGWSGLNRNLLIGFSLGEAVVRLKLDRDELLAEPHAFIDLDGLYVAPFAVAEKLARSFCKTYAQDILRYMQSQEDKWRKEMLDSDTPFRKSWPEQCLDEERPIHALVREWCGQTEVAKFDEITALRDEIHRLHEEIQRLRDVIEKAADYVKATGHPVKAAVIRKELQKGRIS